MTLHDRIRRHFPLALALVLAGCAADAGDAGDEGQASPSGREDARETSSRIVGGTVASGYPEAVLIDMMKNGQVVAACSGSLVAPQVVLTAGHCVVGFNGWKVKAPYAAGQSATASSAATYDYTSTQEYVDANAHDVALVYLDKPITLASYPTIAKSALPSGSKIVNIGRINNGTLSSSNLYVSKAISVQSGSSYGFPYDYVSTEVIESGDSGGPDMAYGTHQIVAVNSGAGGGTEVLARVDLVSSWIATQIASHGGSGGGTGSGGSTGAGGSSGGTTTCAHSLCSTGSVLAPSCDSCAQTICSQDPYCCNTQWDSICVGEVGSLCGKSCP